MATLGMRIRKARHQAAISQAELARRVGVKRSAVTQWEHPDGTRPSVEHMLQVATETGVRFEWLATGRGTARSEDDAAPAVMVDDYARDEHESRVLDVLRRLPPSKRQMAVEILQILAR